MSTVTHIRFISQQRLKSLGPFREPYEIRANVGDVLRTSYDPVTEEFTEWVVVADDDPRAETVMHHEMKP